MSCVCVRACCVMWAVRACICIRACLLCSRSQLGNASCFGLGARFVCTHVCAAVFPGWPAMSLQVSPTTHHSTSSHLPLIRDPCPVTFKPPAVCREAFWFSGRWVLPFMAIVHEHCGLMSTSQDCLHVYSCPNTVCQHRTSPLWRVRFTLSRSLPASTRTLKEAWPLLLVLQASQL